MTDTRLVCLVCAALVIASVRTSVGTEASDMQKNVAEMLEAVSRIRSARDIKLDCKEYVYKYLGQSDSIKHYIDEFGSSGIKPKRKYSGPKAFIHFDIGWSILKDVPKSRFGRDDVVVIVFFTNNIEDDAKIASCTTTLFAAPSLP